MAMTERHEDPAPSGRRMTTGEFRAAPDISASTAQFRAFAEGDSKIPSAYDVGAPDRSAGRMGALVVGVLVVFVIIVILVAKLV